MPKVMKPPAEYDPNNVLTGGDWYDGPLPKPGFYTGPIKKVMLQKGTKGVRWMVLCEIGSGPFKGAGVVKWLQPEGQNIPWFNQWLHSMTDGSEAQMRGITKAFAEIGYTVDKDDKDRIVLVKIGKNFNPIGKVIGFVVKQRTIEQGDRAGEVVAEISRFAVPKGGADDEDEGSAEDVLDDTETVEDVETEVDSDGLDEFAEETTSNPETVSASIGTDSDDDPWSL